MKARTIIAGVAASAFVCGTALAVDLDNKDRKTYSVKIRSGPGGTLNSSIHGNVMKKGVCSSCEIEVVGAGRAKVSGGVTVVIQNGKISVRK